jgi:hypothetical protein
MKDVIEMACEAGFTEGELAFMGDNFRRFAELVRADERAVPCCGDFDKCQQVCMPRAAAQERESFKKECEQYANWLDEAAADIEDWGMYASEYLQQKWDLPDQVQDYKNRAAAIRNRGKQALAAPAAEPETDSCGSGAGCLYKVAMIENLESEVERLKAAQPAFKPLTDDQIEQLAFKHLDVGDGERGTHYVFGEIDFARAIEAAHGITKGQP